jgi:hypothetical protein
MSQQQPSKPAKAKPVKAKPAKPKSAKKKKEKKPKLTPEQREELFKTAKKVKTLKDVKNPIKGQLFKMKTNPGKGKDKDGRAKNLGETETVYKATGKTGFGKFKVVTNRKK